MTVGEFVFRHAGGCLIESPDLPTPPSSAVQSWRWIATVWIDGHAADGWGALEWSPGERGWVLPTTTALGDVIEFGVGWTNADGRTDHVRWWGWIERCSVRALVIVGPYDHPIHATDAARCVVDEVRLSQLAGPDITDPPTSTPDGHP
jgi:hypothetical protein